MQEPPTSAMHTGSFAPPQSASGTQSPASRRMSVSTKISEDEYFILDPQDIIVRKEVQQLLKETTDLFEARLRHMKESFDSQMSTAMGSIARLTHELTVERERRARIERYVMTALRSPADELEAVLNGTLSPRATSVMQGSQSTSAIKPASPRQSDATSIAVRPASSSDTVSAVATSPRLRLDLSRATAQSSGIAEATVFSSNSASQARTSASDTPVSPTDTRKPVKRTLSSGSITLSPTSRSSSSDDGSASEVAVDSIAATRERSGTVMVLPSAERQSPNASPRSRQPSSFSFTQKRGNGRVKTSPVELAEPKSPGAGTNAASAGDHAVAATPQSTATSPQHITVGSATVGAAAGGKMDKKKRTSVFGTIKKTFFKREKDPSKRSNSDRASVSASAVPTSRGPNSLEQLFSSVAQETSQAPQVTGSQNSPQRMSNSDSSSQAVAPIRVDVMGAEIDFTACELTTLPLQIVNRMDQISGLRLGSNKFTAWPELASSLLVELDLSLNDIPSIPASVSKLPNLKSLFVFGNKITKLPSEISQLVHLTLLDLSRNLLTELPPAIGALTNLRELFVFGNKLTALPVEIKNCVALETLDAGENMIRFLPDEICHLSKLRELNLYLNKLSFLPEEIGNLVELREFNVAENFLQELPLSCGKFKYLNETINVTSNRFADDGLRDAVARGPQETMNFLHRRLYAAIVPVPSMNPHVATLQLPVVQTVAEDSLNVWPDSPKMRASPRHVDVPTPPPVLDQDGSITPRQQQTEQPAPSPRSTEAAASTTPAAAPVNPTETSFLPPSKEDETLESSESLSSSASSITPRSPDLRSPSERETKRAMVDNKMQILIKWANQVVTEDLKPELERSATLLARNPTREVLVQTENILECFEKALKRIHQHLPSEFHDSVLDGLLTKLSNNLERKKSVMNIPTVEIEQARQDLQIRIIDVRSKLGILTNILSNRELGNHMIIDVIMSVKEMKVQLGQITSSTPAPVAPSATQPASQ